MEKFDFSADILDSELLKILLIDRTTKKNIIWATNDYLEFGEEYNEKKELNDHRLKDGGLLWRLKVAFRLKPTKCFRLEAR